MLSSGILIWGIGLAAATAALLAVYARGRSQGAAKVEAEVSASRIDAIETANEATRGVDEKTEAERREALIKWSKS